MSDEILTERRGRVTNVVTEPGEASAGAIELAKRITANGPMAVAIAFAEKRQPTWTGT